VGVITSGPLVDDSAKVYENKQRTLLEKIMDYNKSEYNVPQPSVVNEEDEMKEFLSSQKEEKGKKSRKNSVFVLVNPPSIPSMNPDSRSDMSVDLMVNKSTGSGNAENSIFALFTKKSVLPFIILYSLICHYLDLHSEVNYSFTSAWCYFILPLFVCYTYVPSIEEKSKMYLYNFFMYMMEKLLDSSPVAVNKVMPRVEDLPHTDECYMERGEGKILNLRTNTEKRSKNITFKCHTSVENQCVIFAEIDSDSQLNLVEQYYFENVLLPKLPKNRLLTH
jgi:hypothetical protein